MHSHIYWSWKAVNRFSTFVMFLTQVLQWTLRIRSKAHLGTLEISLWHCTRLFSRTQAGTRLTLSQKRLRTLKGTTLRENSPLVPVPVVKIQYVKTATDKITHLCPCMSQEPSSLHCNLHAICYDHLHPHKRGLLCCAGHECHPRQWCCRCGEFIDFCVVIMSVV